MRAVVTRVKEASVRIGGKVNGEIGQGFLILLGVGPEGFWRLSLKEWRMLTTRADGARPLGRGEMGAMMERWPDER